MFGRPSIPVLALLATGLAAVACGPPAGEDRAGAVQLVEGERSTPRPTGAVVRIATPEEGAVVADSPATATLEVENFELAASTPGAGNRGIAMSDRGQHVHFIVDNRPYRAIYDDQGEIDLSGLDTGAHVLRAFASRQWHESVKTDSAFAIRTFYVNDSTPDVDLDPEAPLLTYSRPKGEYRGAGADSVMVDFFLTNAELGPDGHQVRVSVDDSVVGRITAWKPHYLLGLDAGEHAVKLDLLGPDGAVVPGPYNSTERVITVVRETAGAGGSDG